MELTPQEAQIAGAPIICPHFWTPPGAARHSDEADREAAFDVATAPGARVAYRGRTWPVSQAFVDLCVTPHPDLAYAPVDSLWRELILTGRKANAQGGLDRPERQRWEAVCHHLNVRRALSFIGDRPLSDFDMEYADQVHGNSLRTECGCVLHYVFDPANLRASPERNRSPFYDHTPRHVCERHARYASDLEQLRTVVQHDQNLFLAAQREAAESEPT